MKARIAGASTTSQFLTVFSRPVFRLYASVMFLTITHPDLPVVAAVQAAFNLSELVIHTPHGDI